MKRLLLLALASCTQTTELIRPADDGSVSAPDAQAPIGEPVREICGDHVCACSNGLNDDGDDLIDGFDPECSAPFDDREDSFATGAHGEGQDTKCQDCFFDNDSGGQCKRARSCAIDDTPSSGTGACRSCDVTSSCADSCLPLVPNGCDCYGCCEVWRDGAPFDNVLLGSGCSLANLDDRAACVRCQPATDCQNPCGPCELCTGKSLRDLPASCSDGATCEDGPRCTLEEGCPSGQYCLQGCCVQTLL